MMKFRISSGLAAVAAVMTPAVSALAHQQQSEPFRYGYGPQMMGWGGGWYGMIFGPIFMILVLAIVIGLVVLLVRWLAGPRQGSQPPYHAPPGQTPLDILKERYARGEIDKDEYEERRRVLGG